MSKTDVLKGSKVAASSDAELAEIEEGQEEEEASAQFDPTAAGLSNIPAAPPIVIRPEVLAIQSMQREMDSQPDADFVEMDEFIESHQFYAPDRERYGTSIPAEDFLPRTDPEVKMRPDVELWQKSAIKHISAARDRAIKNNPEVDPLIFQSVWDSAYRRILDGSYRSGKMIGANFANDAALDAQVDRGLAEEMRDAEVIAIVRAYDETTGKSVQVPITGTDLDKKLADRLPPSPQKTVLMAGISPTSWLMPSRGALDTELNRKYINEDGRTKTPAMLQRKIRDLYRPQANELGQEIPIPVISVPIFVDPTVGANIQGKNSINLDTVAENTKLSAKSEVTGGRSNAEVREDAMKAYREGSSILDVPRSVADTPEEYAEVVGRVVKDKVQSIVAEEIARIRAELAGQYVFSSNSDSLVDYLEGQTYGGVGEVPYARQVGALSLPVRAIEGKVTGPEGYEKDIADEGGLEFLLGALDKEQLAEAGPTRAVDDLMRVAPTTFQAAPYWQAYKDWLLLNNGEDPKEGRKAYVLKRAGEIAQDPDQLALALATNYDPAGNMLVYAGRIFYPELHEISPVLAGLRGGSPRLAAMLIEPDALQGSFASVGVLGIAGSYIGGRVPRAARIMGRITKAATKLDEAFAGAADAEDLLNRIEALKQSDGTGVFSWVAAQVADSGARKLNGRGAEDIADVVAAENRAYVAAAERVEKSKETLNKAMDGLADAQTAAEKKVSGVLAVDAQVVLKSAEVEEAAAEIRLGQRAIDATLKEDVVTEQAKVLAGLEGAPTASKPLKGDVGTFRGWAAGSPALDPLTDAATLARAAEGDAAAIKTLRNKTNKIASEPPLRSTGVRRADLLKAQSDRLEKLRKLLRNSDLSTDEQTINNILEAAAGDVTVAATKGGPPTTRLRDLISKVEEAQKSRKVRVTPEDQAAGLAAVEEIITTLKGTPAKGEDWLDGATGRLKGVGWKSVAKDAFLGNLLALGELRRFVALAAEYADQFPTAARAAAGSADWAKIVDVIQTNLKSADDQVRAATGALVEAENKLKISERLSEVLAEGPPRSSLLTGTNDLLEAMQETASALRGAAETLTTPEGQRLAKELFYQGGKVTGEIMAAEPEKTAALLEIATKTSDPLAVLAGSGDAGRRIAMSFLALAESGEAQLRGYRQIWNSFSQMKNKYLTSGGKYGSLAEFFTDPLFITQQGLRLVADLVEMSGLATTRVGVLGGRFAARLQEIGNGTAREASAWMGDLGMIAKHFSGKAESGAPLAKAKAVEFVGTQNRIELGGPRKNVDIGSNQLGGDLNQNILNLAIEGWADVGRTFVKPKKGLESEELTKIYSEKSESMFAFVASFVREAVDAGPAKRVGNATVTFGRWLNKPSKADETITNSQAILRTADPEERLRMLANGAIDSLIKNGVGKFTRGPIDDLPGAVLTVENKTFGLMLDNIVGGATEFEFAKRAANFAGPNVGIRNLRAMESRIGRPEAGAEGKSVLPRRETIEVGDRVVLRSDQRWEGAPDRGIDPVRRVLAGKPVEGEGLEKTRGAFEDVEGATRGPQFGLESAEATEFPLSLEVLKIEKKGKRTVVTVMDVFGETSVYNLDDLSRFGAELSTLDLIDGYLVYGLNLMRDVDIPGKNVLDWLRPRDRYVRFVLHSYDEAGNPRIIPKVELGAWAKELANNAKKLDITLSGKRATNPLAAAIGQTFRGALSWWKQSVLFGISGLRSVAFFLTNAQGDFERMAIQVGYREAAQLSMYGTLGWVPMIGPMVQDVARSTTAAASKVTGKLPGVPEPTIFGSQYNAVLDDVLSGVNETRTYFNSRGEAFTINPREFMREARRAGVNEDYLRSESLRELRIAADQEFRGMIPALGASRKGATPAQLYRDWFDILRTTSAVATRRQKLMLFMHLRFNKGMDTSKATDAMNSSIFDYTLSTSPFEAAVLTQWSAFYTYKKNALLNDAVNFLSFDRQLARHLTNKMVFGTRYKRARALFHMETILRPRQDVAGKVVMTLEGAEPPLEKRPGIYKTPDYLTNVMLTQRGALSLDQQRRMIEEGSTPTAFSIGHGAPWAVAQNMNTFALMQKTIIGGLAAAFVGDLHFNSTQAKRDLSGAFLDTLFPTHQSILGSTVKQAFGVYVPRKKETRTLKESEVAFIRMFGLEGLMEKRGEKYVSSSPFVVNGLFDPLAWAGKETEYAGLLLTTIFGEMPLTPEEVKVKQQVYEPGFPLKIEELGIDFDKYKDTGPAGIRIAAADELAKVTYINMFNPTRNISWELQQAQYTHKRRKAAMQGRSDLAESDYKAEKKEESE
tara:strand:- start:4601 stop:11491 length:6891 start_codon:yes stop_codon:yes gene_type:complete